MNGTVPVTREQMPSHLLKTVPVNAPAPPLSAGAHLHQAVPAAIPHSVRWKVCQVGDRWGAFRPWAGSVYWLRLFDTFAAATEFVKTAMYKASVVK